MMKQTSLKVLVMAYGVIVVPTVLTAAPVGARSHSVEARDFCVTRGAVEALSEGAIRIREPKVRAVLAGRNARDVEMQFTYVGPTKNVTRLGSGTLRRQLGLKLRAQDSCNVVYVMWRIEPESQLVVQIKHNPGEHTHAECGTAGYRTVRAEKSSPVPVLSPGSKHRLGAAIDGQMLQVAVDGKAVWAGRLGPEVMEFDGPAGVRTDNAEVEFTLVAGTSDSAAAATPASTAHPCHTDDAADD